MHGQSLGLVRDSGIRSSGMRAWLSLEVRELEARALELESRLEVRELEVGSH